MHKVQEPKTRETLNSVHQDSSIPSWEPHWDEEGGCFLFLVVDIPLGLFFTTVFTLTSPRVKLSRKASITPIFLSEIKTKITCGISYGNNQDRAKKKKKHTLCARHCSKHFYLDIYVYIFSRHLCKCLACFSLLLK